MKIKLLTVSLFHKLTAIKKMGKWKCIKVAVSGKHSEHDKKWMSKSFYWIFIEHPNSAMETLKFYINKKSTSTNFWYNKKKRKKVLFDFEILESEQ